MINKIIKSLLIAVVFLLLARPAWAAEKIYFFWAAGCPHCAKEEAFLNSLKEKYVT